MTTRDAMTTLEEHTRAYLLPVGKALEEVLLDDRRRDDDISGLIGTEPSDVTSLPLPLTTLFMSRRSQRDLTAPKNEPASSGASTALGRPITVRGAVVIVQDPEGVRQAIESKRQVVSMRDWLRHHQVARNRRRA